MKILRFGLVLILAWVASSILHPAVAQNSDSQAPTRFSLRTILPYNPARIGYDLLPVKIVGCGGGKLGPREKFKILASMLRNETQKNIKAVKISSFVFRYFEWDDVLETRQTSLIPIELLASETRRVEALVGYVDDIPLLSYKPGEEFHMELAVTEVHYEDGSIWQATDLPQKVDPTKAPYTYSSLRSPLDCATMKVR